MTNTDKNIRKDLENILKSVAKVENIKNYHVSYNNNEIKGEGLSSGIFTGEVLNKDSGKITQVVIKRAASKGLGAGISDEVFHNEVHFYSEVLPELQAFQKEKNIKQAFDHVPRYFAGNEKSENAFVAMENLKTEGYVLFDKRKFLDGNHLEFIFKTYGKFHALSFSFKQENAQKYETLVKPFAELMKKYTDSGESLILIKKAYLGALEAFNPVTDANILTKLKTIKDIAKTFGNVLMYKGSHRCLVHGDCWSNNMLFKYRNSGELEDIKLIDFQIARSSTPIHDLSYFFYSGASKEDMDKLDYYLELYYESFSTFAKELGETAEEIFPLDVLKREWKEYALWGVLLGCQLWLFKLLDREEIESGLEDKGLTTMEHMEKWSERLSKVVERIDFRERAKNILLHAMEYGII